ncbi:MAG: peptidoglycan DD-metalloendopeptidase family protein [Candidatus Pacebacteria bacterium]|nr:peptidoglycan DD-metalloendopeptidase family protein [Candidatus Paceibacterota bacterium]
MNKKTVQFVANLSLIGLLVVAPVSLFANHRDYDDGDGFGRGTSDWRYGNSEMRENIEDLDNDPVEDISIPVLFGVGLKNLTRNFGDQRVGHLHEGLDIMAAEGTPIVSPTDAVVTRMGDGSGSGLFVATAVPGDESFVYMHLSELADIDEGDVLEAGDLIGYVGHTGNAVAAAPHLHFEIRDEDGDAIDPYPRLTQVFDLDDTIEYLEKILDDADDEDELAEFLVTKFRSVFITAMAQDIDLPDATQDAMETIVAPVVVVSYGSSTGTLRVGSRGPEVVILQNFLVKKGVGSASRVIADGAFGPITRQALIDYQASVGLVADGIYGPKSKAYVTSQM